MPSMGDAAGGMELCVSNSACQQGQVCTHSTATGGAGLLPLCWSRPTPPW